MRMARKKALVVEAYRLGEKSPEIEALMKEGKIKKTEDGRFEIFSHVNIRSGQLFLHLEHLRSYFFSYYNGGNS